MGQADLDDLQQATGVALALVGSLLESSHLIPRGEFSRHLANLASVTDETNPAQGALLRRWAELTGQTFRDHRN